MLFDWQIFESDISSQSSKLAAEMRKRMPSPAGSSARERHRRCILFAKMNDQPGMECVWKLCTVYWPIRENEPGRMKWPCSPGTVNTGYKDWPNREVFSPYKA